MKRPPDLIDRIDRKLGRLFARFCGTIALLGAIGALSSLLTIDDFSLATYWPVIGFALLMLVIARACFRTRTGILEQLSETPNFPQRKRD
jgi:hypothetical protein